MIHLQTFFDVLLTVHLSIFISVFKQRDAQNLLYNKFYFMPLHVSSTCAHHQEVKIALHGRVMEEYSHNSTHPLGHTGPVTGSLYLYIYISQVTLLLVW